MKKIRFIHDKGYKHFNRFIIYIYHKNTHQICFWKSKFISLFADDTLLLLWELWEFIHTLTLLSHTLSTKLHAITITCEMAQLADGKGCSYLRWSADTNLCESCTFTGWSDVLQLINIMQLLTPGIDKEFCFCQGLLMTCRDAGFWTKTVNPNCSPAKQTTIKMWRKRWSGRFKHVPQRSATNQNWAFVTAGSLASRTPTDTKSPLILTLLRRSHTRRPARKCHQSQSLFHALFESNAAQLKQQSDPPKSCRLLGTTFSNIRIYLHKWNAKSGGCSPRRASL